MRWVAIGAIGLLVASGCAAADGNSGPPICAPGSAPPVVAVDEPLPAALRDAVYRPLPVGQVSGSLDYLEQTYHVTEAEAQIRLNLQLESHPLAEWLKARYPDTLGEISLDQQRGVIAVETTDRPAMQADAELNAYPHRGRVDLRDTHASTRQRQAYGACVAGYLQADDDEQVQLEIVMDPLGYQIVLRVADTKQGRAFLKQPRVRVLVARSGGLITTATHPWREPIKQRQV